MSIVITGASGSYGRQVTELLLEKVPASELILVTRKPGALAQLAARGAQVRAGDFDKPETLVPALAGAEKMLLISTLAVGSRRQQQHAPQSKLPERPASSTSSIPQPWGLTRKLRRSQARTTISPRNSCAARAWLSRFFATLNTLRSSPR